VSRALHGVEQPSVQHDTEIYNQELGVCMAYSMRQISGAMCILLHLFQSAEYDIIYKYRPIIFCDIYEQEMILVLHFESYFEITGKYVRIRGLPIIP
jgi:hypothetical protein